MNFNFIKKIISHPIIILICRIIVGYIFLSFGISKLAEPALFAKEISHYDIAPLWSINLIAIFIPWIEILAGLMFLLGVLPKTNSIIIGGLLVFFIIMVASAWARGLNINCGCSQVNPTPVGLKKIIENSISLIMCIIVYLYPTKKLTIFNPSLKNLED